MLSTPYAFFKRDFLIAASYKSAFVAEVVGILGKVVTFYFVGEVFGGYVSPDLAAYDNNYFAFLIIGIALMDFMRASLEIFDTSIRESQLMGTLEIVLLSPIRLSSMLLYSSLWMYVFTVMKFLVYLLFGALLFDLNMGNADPWAAVVFLTLSILCFAPIGIISATITLIFKRGVWFRSMVQGIFFLLGGVAFPISVLPEWLSQISYYIPMTHCVEGMRQSLLRGEPLAALHENIVFLLLFAAVAIPLSLLTFHLGVARTKGQGTLTHY